MSDEGKQTGSSGTGDIQWQHLSDSGSKAGKASGIKIEYSMSDEIDFARKLAIKIRKKSMQQLLESEDEMLHRELDSMGLVLTLDAVCKEIRQCSTDLAYRKKTYKNINETASLSKMFKMLED